LNTNTITSDINKDKGGEVFDFKKYNIPNKKDTLNFDESERVSTFFHLAFRRSVLLGELMIAEAKYL